MIYKGKEITEIQQVKSIEIKVLNVIVDFCEQHNLKYLLAYGTLLGAVRHKGFIPWDDDIDIFMPRPDYQKLISLWKDNDNYGLLECTKNKNYIYPFAKMYDKHTIILEKEIDIQCDMGIYVDIFPYDSINNTYEESRKFLKKCETYEKCRLYSALPYEKILHENKIKNLGRFALWRVLKTFGPAYFSRKENQLYQKYADQFDTTEQMGCLWTRKAELEIVPRNVFDETMDMEFEGKMYKIPANYDVMLKTKYGDYMQLPPEEDRVLHHGFKVWECERK